MMTQGFYGRTADNGFREYLASSMSNMFALDLTNCTVIECIDKMCEIKSRSHPKIKQDYRMLVNKLRSIEQQFGCTIMSGSGSSMLVFIKDDKDLEKIKQTYPNYLIFDTYII